MAIAVAEEKSRKKFSKKTYLDWYKSMLLMRRFEEKAGQLYIQQKIRGFCHLYIGQEALIAGTVSAIRKSDNLITAYRDPTVGTVVVAVAGFTPIPYKVITITAGAARISLVVFLVVSTLSRSARFFLVAGLFGLFGDRMKPFIDRYFNLLCLVFVGLLVGGFLVLRYSG